MKPFIQLLFVCLLSNAFFCQHSSIEAIPKDTALKTQIIKNDTKNSFINKIYRDRIISVILNLTLPFS